MNEEKNRIFLLPLRRLISRYSHRFLSPWFVLFFDVSVIFFTFYLAYTIRMNFELEFVNLARITNQALGTTLVYAVSFYFFRSFSGIIRHTGFVDAFRLFQASGVAFLFLIASAYLSRTIGVQWPWTTSLSVLLIHFLLAYFVLMGSRVVVKTVFSRLIRTHRKKRKRVIIYGAGSSGMLTRNALMQDHFTSYQVVAFVDDNPGKANKRLEGIPVLLPEKVFCPEFQKKFPADQLIISIQNLNRDRRKEIIENALEYSLEVKVVPPIDNWINGRLSAGQIRKVRIEELLEREPIRMDNSHVARELRDKVVLITGAAGSIGSGIVRQVLPFLPAKVILLDQAESGLYDLQTDIQSAHALQPYANRTECVVASIKDRYRMEQVFRKYKPDIIYHAAAYKHVPLMEQNPYEALLVNVFGTKAITDLAVQYKVQKFVMVSTDKAVNPTNVMGASKRIAEIYTQSMSNGTTQFITTRFGNVLDSNGSVIPLFRRQIEQGGPLTITHKEITRYFMMINEACSLVLEAGAMGKGGEIFVFDMGEPVKIIDLARKMIQLSGLEPGKDILVEEIGLRPGEKLFEEVLNDQENTLHTYHPKILRAKVRTYPKEPMIRHLDELAELILDGNEFQLVAKMKAIVPEYISNNSVFNSLDKPASGISHPSSGKG